MSSPKSSGTRLVGVAAILAVIISGAAIWYFGMRNSDDRALTPPSLPGPGAKGPPVAAPPPVVLHESAAELSSLITQPGQSEQERIQYVEKVLYLYRQALGGNPSGHNELVVNALLGENEKGAALLPKDCPAIQGGELVDEWGTPYWFHSVTAKDMEVRSAGPDKELFTADDVVPDVRE